MHHRTPSFQRGAVAQLFAPLLSCWPLLAELPSVNSPFSRLKSVINRGTQHYAPTDVLPRHLEHRHRHTLTPFNASRCIGVVIPSPAPSNVTFFEAIAHPCVFPSHSYQRVYDWHLLPQCIQDVSKCPVGNHPFWYPLSHHYGKI
jgi:hypothetical protein